MRRHIVILVAGLLLSIAGTRAQDSPEYLLELGAGVGVMTYVGDLNGNLLRQMQPMGGVVAKYKPTPRVAWAGKLNVGQLKGSSTNVETYYPVTTTNPIEFKTALVDFDVTFEYNFWAFGTGREYHGARSFTPYIALGAGLSFASADVKGPNPEKKSAVGFQLPIGVGVKYKVAERLNLSAQWMMHFTGTDKIDGLADPYGIKSSGLFKNTDGYATLQVALTYDLWAKCKTCHNDRD